MKSLLTLLLLGPAVVEEVRTTPSVSLEADKISNKCESLFISSQDKEGVLLSFNSTLLEVGSSKKIDFLSCKISWKPSLPANKRLKSAELVISGKMSAQGKAEGLLRVGHKMLGMGTSPSLESWDLSDGPFSYKIQVQNLGDNCGLDVKLISTFSLVLTRSTTWTATPEGEEPKLSLASIRVLPLELEDCSPPESER